MKKIIGISILSTMLLLGQPMMVFADTTISKVINFEDIESAIAEHNIDVQINQNSGLKDKVDLSDLKRTIKDLEDDLDNVNSQRDQASDPTQISGILTVKRALLDALKEAERGLVDRPTLEAMIDLKNKMSNDTIVLTAEGIFVNYDKLNSAISSISTNIENLQKKLSALELQESLGMVSHNSVNDLKTTLVDLQTQLESKKFQQLALERQFSSLLNDQENTFCIGSIKTSDEKFNVDDEDADLKKALENNYAIKLQELQIITQEAALDRAKKDNGVSSKAYKKANYDLTNSNLKLDQLKDKVRVGYQTMTDNIVELQSDLQLAEQMLEDKKVDLSEAQLKMGLGMISQLELDDAKKEYLAQENIVKTKQVDLFNAKCNYDWFLKGMSQS